MQKSTPHSRRFVAYPLRLLLLWATVFLSTQAYAFSAPTQSGGSMKNFHTVIPSLSNEELINPGKGWVLYGSPQTQSAQTLKYASVGYMRYNWSDIEPTEGRYTWSRIDSDMGAWTALGKRFAFGVMNANSSTPTNSYVTPNGFLRMERLR